MQNIESENENHESLESQHHPNRITSPNNSSNTTSIRTQNFSFASTYQPSTGQFLKSQPNEVIPTNPKLSAILSKGTFNNAKPISSFSVLNNDDFYSPVSLVGSKPNAIVRPIRRPDQITLPGGKQYGQQHHQYQKQQQYQEQQQHQENDTDSTHTSQSQPYQYQLSGSSVTQAPVPRPRLNYSHDFTEELNRKLHYLHNREHFQALPHWTSTGYRHNTIDVGKSAKGKGTTTSLGLTQRPLFITTVPTGVFLPPPKEMPLPQFLRPYVYSSHPMVLSDTHSSNYNKSPTFSKDKLLRGSGAMMTAGDKDFTTTTTTAAPSSLSSSARINTNQQNANYAQSLAGGVHLTNEQFRQQIQQHRAKRDENREPYKNVMFDRRVVRGSNFSKNRMQPQLETSDHSAEERQHKIPRYRPLFHDRQKRSLQSESNQPRQRDEIIQTDEEYLIDMKKKRSEFSVNTQTELVLYPDDSIQTPNKNCVDASTEIGEHEFLFQDELETQSLIDFFVNMCFEQTVIEMAYEVQMDDLNAKYKALESQLSNESKDIERIEGTPNDTTAAKLLQGHIAKLVPEVLENLESAAYIEPTKKDEVMKTICPWLTVEVAEEVGHIVDSREILTVIIEEIIKQRAAAYSDVKNMPEIVANIEEVIDVSNETTDKNGSK